MRMRRISEIGTRGRLEAFYRKRVEALVNVLQQKLDYFSPKQDIDYSMGAGNPKIEDVSRFEGAGDFTVEPVPSQDPSVSLAYVKDESGREVMVDTTIAASFLDQLSAGATNADIWGVLESAAAETASSLQHFSPEDQAAQTLWEQQFIARRTPFLW